MPLNFITSNPTIDQFNKDEKEARERRLSDARAAHLEDETAFNASARPTQLRRMTAEADTAESNADVGRQTVGSRVKGAGATAAHLENQNFIAVLNRLDAGDDQGADELARQQGVTIPQSLRTNAKERAAWRALFDQSMKMHPGSPQGAQENFRAWKDEADKRIAAGENPDLIYDTFATRFGGAQQAPGGPAAQTSTARGTYQAFPGEDIDPATGKTTRGLTVFNRDEGTAEFTPGATITGRAGGAGGAGRSSVFQQKQSAWIETHPGDSQGALDYASGRRTMSPADAMKSARSMAGREISQDPTIIGTKRTAAIEARTQEIYKQLQGAGAPPAAPAAPAQINMRGNGTQQEPYAPTSREDYDQITSGTYFVNPSDGKVYLKK